MTRPPQPSHQGVRADWPSRLYHSIRESEGLVIKVFEFGLGGRAGIEAFRFLEGPTRFCRLFLLNVKCGLMFDFNHFAREPALGGGNTGLRPTLDKG